MRSLALAFVAGLLAVLVGPSPAFAHTGLDASDPADGEVVDGPLEQVVLDFTGTPTAIDDGIAVADSAGATYVPAAVTQDGLRITARFDPPLPAGSYALSWVVRSDDTHTVDGSFTFFVEVPAPSTKTTIAPAVADPAADDADAVAAEQAAAAPPAPPSLPGVDDVEDGETVATLGRLVFIPAGVVAVGVLAFAGLAFAGSRQELDSLFWAIRWLGVGVAFGAVLEVAGLASVFGGAGELFDDGAGRAAAARVIAGICLVAGFGSVAVHAVRPLSAAVVGDVATADPDTPSTWRPRGRDVVGLVGAAIFVFSFAFDGHTATEGPRAVHALASVAHVAAASVWAGGLVAFAVVLVRRHRRGVPAHALPIVLRFSVVAMVSLAAAGLAGVVMAWFIQDDLGSYTSTEWGRLMLLKLGVVVVAAALGGFNHFVLKPALESSPGDPGVLERIRRSVTAEAGLVVLAASVTAVLVGASAL